jgi:hypothetical protein
MSQPIRPDLFRNVHKGIRRALFDVCLALGRAGDDAPADARLRGVLRDVMHFVAHHGDNEDVLLVPILRRANPALAARMEAAHAPISAALELLVAAIDREPFEALHLRVAAFTALYLAHMDDEERVLEPEIVAALSLGELVEFGRGAVERTAPHDQRAMLGWMLPAMTKVDVDAFLARVPPGLASELRALVDVRPSA